MRRWLTYALFILALCATVLAAPLAHAQSVVNPTGVTWDHADYATAAHYEGGYFALPVTAGNACDLTAAPAATATQTDNLGKPTTTTGVAMTAALLARPIGCYVYRVRVLDQSGLYSDWSAPSDPFKRTPAAPGKPAPK